MLTNWLIPLRMLDRIQGSLSRYALIVQIPKTSSAYMELPTPLWKRKYKVDAELFLIAPPTRNMGDFDESHHSDHSILNICKMCTYCFS